VKTVALKLDEETGAQEWKYDNSSPISMLKLFPYRLNLLRKYRTQQRVLDALYLLQKRPTTLQILGIRCSLQQLIWGLNN
jgi:hypothetical protein